MNAPVIHASDGFFTALGVPLRAGRDIARDGSAAGSAIVSQSLAVRLFGHVDVVGERIRIRAAFNQEPVTRVIAGVAGDVRQNGYESEMESAFYVPFAEQPQPQIAFAIRTNRDPLDLATAVRRVVAEVNPAVAPMRIATTRATADEAIATREALALVSALFGGAALVLVVLGIYGLVAQNVARRRREIGIRIAVGARASQVLWLVLTEAFRLASAGVALGILGALAVSGFLRAFLWGIRATDPLTFAAVGATALLAATAASLVPARRAARTDPIDSLRSD